MDMYEGTAEYADGTEIRTGGSIQQMANWADNLIRVSETDLTIRIERVDDRGRK